MRTIVKLNVKNQIVKTIRVDKIFTLMLYATFFCALVRNIFGF